jgi:hypothetical protein
MPTYTNNYHKPIAVKNNRGAQELLQPGDTIETWFFSGNELLTKDSDAPLFPRTPGIEAVAATVDGVEVSISPDCDFITVEQISSSIDVYADIDDPAQQIIKEKTADDAINVIECFGTISKLIIKGDSTCVVYQHRRIPCGK